MALELAEVLRIKGTIDGVLRTTGDGFTAASTLTRSYMTTRQRCSELLLDTDVEGEFRDLFPEIEDVELPSFREIGSMSLPKPIAPEDSWVASPGGWAQSPRRRPSSTS